MINKQSEAVRDQVKLLLSDAFAKIDVPEDKINFPSYVTPKATSVDKASCTAKDAAHAEACAAVTELSAPGPCEAVQADDNALCVYHGESSLLQLLQSVATPQEGSEPPAVGRPSDDDTLVPNGGVLVVAEDKSHLDSYNGPAQTENDVNLGIFMGKSTAEHDKTVCDLSDFQSETSKGKYADLIATSEEAEPWLLMPKQDDLKNPYSEVPKLEGNEGAESGPLDHGRQTGKVILEHNVGVNAYKKLAQDGLLDHNARAIAKLDKMSKIATHLAIGDAGKVLKKKVDEHAAPGGPGGTPPSTPGESGT